MDGFGVYTYADNPKHKYQGQWKNSQKNGLGKEFFADGSIYEGSFQNGLKYGHGTYTWPH